MELLHAFHKEPFRVPPEGQAEESLKVLDLILYILKECMIMIRFTVHKNGSYIKKKDIFV